jgi:hypothetical protein
MDDWPGEVNSENRGVGEVRDGRALSSRVAHPGHKSSIGSRADVMIDLLPDPFVVCAQAPATP